MWLTGVVLAACSMGTSPLSDLALNRRNEFRANVRISGVARKSPHFDKEGM